MRHKNIVTFATTLLIASTGLFSCLPTAKAEKAAVPQVSVLTGTPVGHSALRKVMPSQKSTSIPKTQNLRESTKPLPMAPSGTVSSGIDLRGCNLAGLNDNNIYNIPVTSGGSFTALGDLWHVMYCGYDNGNGTFYGVNFTNIMDIFLVTNYFTYDYNGPNGWWPSPQIKVEPTHSFIATDLAYDKTSDKVYGCFYTEDATGYEWGTVVYDGVNSSREKICDLTMPLYGVGVDATGQYYAVAADGSFNKVDKTTGSLTKIGDTGLTIDRVCSGCYNDTDGNFLMAYANSSGSGLAAIDPATGKATTVTTFADNQQVTCLHIVSGAQAGGIPASPYLTVSCPDGSMNANVDLTMPAEYADGSSASGQTFDWTIMLNGVTNCTGSAAAGETVTRTIAVTDAGENTFSAFVSNSEGSSEIALTKCFIGKGAPETPQNVTLSVSGQTATLTWDPVTTSSDGGYLNPADVTYTVYDSAGNILAEGLQSCTWTQSLAGLNEFSYLTYVVRAFNGDIPSMPSMSNGVNFGALEAPLFMDMSVSENFEKHKVFDSNNDKHTWMYRNGRSYYEFSIINKADDWLISPRISLKADKYYLLRTVMSTSYDGNPEYVEIKMGNEPTVEAMTTTVAENYAIGFEDSENLSVIHPSADGFYSIGYHAVSDASDNFIYIKSYAIATPMTEDAPSAAQNIVVSDDPTAKLRAQISFTAPDVAVSGKALSGTLKARITRDDKLVEEIDCAPGSENTVFDTTLPEIGTYTYTVTVFSATGEEGVPARGKGYVGPHTPMSPSNVTLRQLNESSVELKWEPVSKDILGNEILPTQMGYDIYMQQSDGEDLVSIVKVNDEPVTHTSFVIDQLEIPSEQQFLYVAVKAVTRGLESDMAYGYGLIGDAYNMPVIYTSQASIYEHFMAYSGEGYPAWVSSDRYKVPGQDGDNEFLITLNDILTDVTIQSGNVKLSNENPALIFYIWKLPNSTVEGMEVEDENESEVYVVDGHDTKLIAHISNKNLKSNQWNKICLSLADYSGKVVSVKIRALCKTYGENLYDNIRICENLPCDLSSSISAPEEAFTGDPFNISVDVLNNGSEDVDSYKVELLRDGVLAEVKEISERLVQGGGSTVTFTQQLTLNDGDAVEYNAHVVAEKDGDKSNDMSSTVRVRRLKSAYPAPTGLHGESVNGDNELAWDDVDISDGFMMSMLEDMESADSWADALTDWTFIDVDQGDSGGFQGVPIPNHPQHSQYSFFVFDFKELSNSEYVVSQNMRPYSGDKYLATMYRIDGGQIDDWAISPKLTGHSQTITLWARSYSSDYPETLEVWYSLKDSTNPEDFVKLEDFEGEDLPAVWQKYYATLPEGAVRFALRSCATNSFMLMVDDISYQKINTTLELILQGFNVYCDGQLVTEAPVSALSYVHKGAGTQKRTYNVTAVYNYGESEYSEPVEVDPSNALCDITASSAVVSVNDRVISVAGAGDRYVTVMRADGVMLHHVSGDTSFAVTPGVYVVTVGSHAVKVSVK